MKDILKFVGKIIIFPLLIVETIIKLLFISIITFFVIIAILIGIKTKKNNNII